MKKPKSTIKTTSIAKYVLAVKGRDLAYVGDHAGDWRSWVPLTKAHEYSRVGHAKAAYTNMSRSPYYNEPLEFVCKEKSIKVSDLVILKRTYLLVSVSEEHIEIK